MLEFYSIFEVVLVVIVLNIRQAEAASCQCSCLSDGTGNPGIQNEGNYSKYLLPKDTLPEDMKYCLTEKKCICYDVWKDEMDRKMYKPCGEECGEYFQGCMDLVPGKSLEFYAYRCRPCNVEYRFPPHNKMNHCILKVAAVILETIEYAEKQGQVYKFCSR